MSLSRVLLWVVVVSLQGSPLAGQVPGEEIYEFPEVSIAGSEARTVTLRLGEDALWVYRYGVSNPGTSDAGVKSFSIDVSLPRGAGSPLLEINGRFLGDATQGENADRSHVPIGLDIPEEWTGYVFSNGYVEWLADSDFLAALDPMEPGEERAEFKLRSTHLPGVRPYRLVPDYPHICCPFPVGDPRNDTIDVKEAEDFAVEGVIVGPTHEPGAMTPSVMLGQLEETCDLAWISNQGICRSLEAKLKAASQALDRSRPEAARGQLRAFLNELDAQRGRHINDNAYWLLRTNGEFLVERLGEGG